MHSILFFSILFHQPVCSVPVQQRPLTPPLQHGGHGAPPLQHGLDHGHGEDGGFGRAHLTGGRGGSQRHGVSSSSDSSGSFSRSSHPGTDRLLFNEHHALLPGVKGHMRWVVSSELQWAVFCICLDCSVNEAVCLWRYSVTQLSVVAWVTC